MSRALFSRNDDLKRLRDEGYFVQVIGGFLVMRDVPYVDSKCEVQMGTLISSLTLAGDQTRRPDTHVIHFDGDFPCGPDGTPIRQISHQSGTFDLGHDLTARHSFSSKPEGGYSDYFDKMTTYAAILSGPAAVLKPDATPRTMKFHGAWSRIRFEDSGRTRKNGSVGRHLVEIIGVAAFRLARKGVPRREVVPEVEGPALVGDLTDRSTVRPARKVAIEVDDMRIWAAGLISGQGQARDQGAHLHLALAIDVRNVAHHEEAADDLNEIAFVPEALEVVVTTEQCA